TVEPSGPCPGVVAETSVTVTTAPSASISYPLILCNVVSSPETPNLAVAVVHTGTSGGVYSISPSTGLSVNPSTGTIDPSGASPGVYTITYTIAASGGCSIYKASAQVTVNGTPNATISYPGSPYCN